MKKVKMTANDKKKGLFAGLIYELSDKDAEKYIDAQQAIEVNEKPKKEKVEHGDR